MGPRCFKFFFDHYLWDKLRKENHDPPILSSVASTLAGKIFFDSLKNDPPEGIRMIEFTLQSSDPYSDIYKVEKRYKTSK